MSRVEALVVGGGLAGAAAAIVLARAGRSVVLLEKEPSAKPKVCGEFLSASALASLSELGCDAVELGAVPLDTFRMAARGRAVSVALPFQAASVTRAALDEALLAKAAHAGATVLRGAAVRTISRDDGGWRADTAHTTYRADSLLLATGKSDLKERRRGTGLHDGMVGLKRYGHGAGATTSIDIALFPGGYCGIQPVEDGRLNVCLAVSARALKAYGGPEGTFNALTRHSPHAAMLLSDVAFEGATLAVGRVPYGMVRRSTDGVFYLGDQAAVIASYCGEGMGLALRSGIMAGEVLLAGGSADDYQANFAALARMRVQATGLMSRAMCTGALQPAIAGLSRALPTVVRALASATRTPLPPPSVQKPRPSTPRSVEW